MVSKERKEKYNHTFLNSYALSVFRYTADNDYIAARQSFRAELYAQFLWSAQQAIEKYLKCVLVLNKVKLENNKGLHSLNDLLNHFNWNHSLYSLRIRPESMKFIEHLDRCALSSRYLSAPFYVLGEHLCQFDAAVWDVRRYCEPLDFSFQLPDGSEKSLLDLNLKRIIESEEKPPQHFKLKYLGLLEKLVFSENNKNLARQSLLWKNNFFGKRVRTNIPLPAVSVIQQSELTLQPEMLDVVSEYVFIDKNAKDRLKNDQKRQSVINSV